MNKERAEYIINYFSKLLSREEETAIRHTRHSIQTDDSPDNPMMRAIYLKHGWITEDQKVFQLLLNGYDHFQIQTAKRILEQNPDKVFFNNCPNCGKLARTPLAKQCRFCSYSWHSEISGTFRLKNSFKVTNRGLFLTGEIVSGEISRENLIDLTFAGINKKATIKSVEEVRKIENNQASKLVALQIGELTETENQKIIDFGSSFNQINIFKTK